MPQKAADRVKKSSGVRRWSRRQNRGCTRRRKPRRRAANEEDGGASSARSRRGRTAMAPVPACACNATSAMPSDPLFRRSADYRSLYYSSVTVNAQICDRNPPKTYVVVLCLSAEKRPRTGPLARKAHLRRKKVGG